MFKENEVAKLAYVYMAQALSLRVPAFCLVCLGTDNRYTAEDVLKRWKYIFRVQTLWHYSCEFWCRW